jgi:hypothetical protein
MSKVTLLFEDPLKRLDTAIAPARVINAELETVQELPLVLNQPLDISLTPGEYLIRVSLPSGEAVSKRISVADKPQLASIQAPIQSPRERFQPQVYFGEDVVESTPETVQAWAVLWRRALTEQQWRDEAFPGTELTRTGGEVLFEHEVPKSEVHVLQVGAPEIAATCTVLSPGHTYEAAIGVVPGRRGKVSLRTGIVNKNQELESFLRFFSSGQTESLRILAASVTTATDLLLHKMEDPIGAAIGAYYLLFTGQLPDYATGWIDNLAQRFPWLPDAAVLKGWQTLNNPEDLESRGARQELLHAAKAGIPFFTVGLRRLYDGLRLIMHDPSAADLDGAALDALQQAFNRVEEYAGAADFNSALTAYKGIDPDSPTRRSAIPMAVGARMITFEAQQSASAS